MINTKLGKRDFQVTGVTDATARAPVMSEVSRDPNGYAERFTSRMS